jgi:hypothetical protein
MLFDVGGQHGGGPSQIGVGENVGVQMIKCSLH